MASTGIISSSTHGSLLHSSFEKAIWSSPHCLASTASPFAMHRTFRDFSPPPHGLLHFDQGPENHWPGHSLPVSHSLLASGFSSALHFDSSLVGLMTSLSNCAQWTFRVCTPLPQSTEHLLHWDVNHWYSHLVWLHSRVNSGR